VSPAASPGTSARTEPESLSAREIDPASIRITVLDIYYCVNEIAIRNGYSTLDEQGTQKPDPNRIYPGGVLTLPNASSYVIDLRDTMWGISTWYIRENIRELCQAYKELMLPYGTGPVPPDKKAGIVEEIRSLVGRSKSENLRRAFEGRIRNL
jgi:hypothetical protein